MVFGIVSSDVDGVVDLPKTWQCLSDQLKDPKWKRNVTTDVLKGLPLKLQADIGDHKWLKYEGSDVTSVQNGPSEAAAPKETDCAAFVVSANIAIRDTIHGKAWIAETSIPAGTTVLVERPMAGILDHELRKKQWGGTDGADTSGLCEAMGLAWQKGSHHLTCIMETLHPCEARETEEKTPIGHIAAEV